jgi:hypothetical protein
LPGCAGPVSGSPYLLGVNVDAALLFLLARFDALIAFVVVPAVVVSCVSLVEWIGQTHRKRSQVLAGGRYQFDHTMAPQIVLLQAVSVTITLGFLVTVAWLAVRFAH